MINSCSYCLGKKCGLKEMLSCKTREIIQENKGLESRLREYIQSDSDKSTIIDNLEKAFEPILKVDLNGSSHLPEDCILAIKESKRLYQDLIVSNLC